MKDLIIAGAIGTVATAWTLTVCVILYHYCSYSRRRKIARRERGWE